jgi:hypothetical protein
MYIFNNLFLSGLTHEGAVKNTATIITICLTLPLLYVGCSKEEHSQSTGENYKVMPITRPAPEKTETSLSSDKEKSKEESNETKEVPAATTPESVGEPSEIEPAEKETKVQEVTGCYIVKQGESLSSIAARDEVYGDPLKWPLLYRHNMGKIGDLQLVEEFLNRELPEGVELRIISTDEARERLGPNANCTWVVNVLSSTTQKALIPSAIRLMRDGYLVYLTSAVVRGRKWMRLRVGFFKTKLEADLERKKINSLLSIRNSWVTEVDQEEHAEFGGY